MKTVDITYAGRTVALPDLADYAKFYGKLSAGIWEPRTFEVLARNLDAGTVYIDIGAWIGVTPLWASAISKRVIAVEPDPKCFAILQSLATGYGNVAVIHAALSPDPRVTIHAVGGFGSSESSILDIGDGESAAVRGIGMDEIMAKAGAETTFVKIDIEGYEFAATAELARLRHYNVRGLQLAVHPQLLEKSLKGPWLLRRLRTAWKVWRLAKLFRPLFPPPRLAKYNSLANYIAWGVVFRKEPKGADLVFERSGPGSYRETP